MPKCVFRTDLRERPVGEPIACVDVSELYYRVTGPTVEESVHMLLAPDEICLGVTDKRQVMKGARVVGYIRIVDLA